MPAIIDFIFDFGSPNAYFSYKILPSIAARTGAEIHMNPCLIGGIFKATGNKPPVVAFGGVKGKLAYEQLEIMRFIEKHGLHEFTFNPHFPVNTLLMMRGAVAMQMEGAFDDYVEAGFRCMWEEGLKMDDPEVFVEALTQAGLDGAAILERTQEPEVKQQLMKNTEDAVSRGVFGAPTFFVGDEMFFGKDRLQQVEEEAAKQR